MSVLGRQPLSTHQSETTPKTTPLIPELQLHFPLLKLPAELRNWVYDFALTRDAPIAIGGLGTRNEAPLSPALLRTNHQINCEARYVFLNHNTFQLDINSGASELNRLPQSARSSIIHARVAIRKTLDVVNAMSDQARLFRVLKYCYHLKSLHITVPPGLFGSHSTVPLSEGFSRSQMMDSAVEAFSRLRWLPQGCSVTVEGNIHALAKEMIDKEAALKKSLDAAQYEKHRYKERT